MRSDPSNTASGSAAFEALSGIIDGRFELTGIVGVGGMAIVHRARDLETDRTVALKVLRSEIVHPEVCARFAREVALTRGLTHPGILEVIAAGEVGGRPYFVMPFVQGHTLKDMLGDGSALPIGEAVRIAASIGETLAYTHAHNVVHRDIKPANILLDGNKVVLADFGIARAVDLATAERLTETGVVIGTAHYMSPEQATGDHVDARTDIYSLGCVLYEMLAGSPPFQGRTTRELLARHAATPPPGLRDVRATIPEQLEQVVLRCLNKVPADRFATARELVVALRAVDDSTARRMFARRTRRRVLGAAAAAGAVAVAAAVIMVQMRSPHLDPNRVLVLPLLTRSAGTPASAGEDAATMIGATIDGVGLLRSVDGWRLLDVDQRRDISALTANATRRLVHSSGSSYIVSGSIVTRGDSCDVYVDLFDAAGDKLTSGKASALVGEAWRATVRAVNLILPRLVGAQAADAGASWQNREPKAVAAYLQGEAAFRRLQMREALLRFREALAIDSLLTLAALRGAQASTWNHLPSQGAELARIALRQLLAPRDAHFARGLEAYAIGNADSAINELRRATDMDPMMSVAWMQLGETYTHLLPYKGRVDSAAGAALSRAYALDTASASGVYHLAERAARQGDKALVSRYLRLMRGANADTLPVRNIETMQRCAEAPKKRVDWSFDARVRPQPLLNAAVSLAATGAQLACAADAFAALLATDTASSDAADGRRFAALLGLVSIRHAQGQPDSATAEIDRFVKRWSYGSSLLVRQTFVSDANAERGAATVREDSARFGADFSGVKGSNRLWLLGVWSARNGRLDAATGAARELSRRDSTRAPSDRMYAQSVLAHVAVARGDTVGAMRLLTRLVGAPVQADDLIWNESRSMADERLLLARLLLAKGRPAEAGEVAEVFDSPQPEVFLMYLMPSLELRLRAAEMTGDRDHVTRLRARVAAIRASFTAARAR